VALSPQRKRNDQRLDARLLPPRCFVTMPVDFAMVEPTNRNCEFVAHLSPERARLGKAQVMRVGRCPAANNAGMGRDEPAVLFVT
jgi:hypothetical protein